MILPSDAAIVELMAKLYAPAPGDFDHIEDPGTDDGVCWAVKQYGNVAVLVFRGSTTVEDWFRDAISELSAPPAKIARCADLGDLPLGFDQGMYEAMGRWGTYAGPRLVIAGHSLGAARACIAAGLELAYGATVERLVLCGCPRPGTSSLGRYLSVHQVPIASYRNLKDPVCDVPTGPPWSHVVPFIALAEGPEPGDIGVFRDHHIQLYQAGVAKLGVTT